MYEYNLKRIDGLPVLIPVKKFDDITLSTPKDIYDFFIREYSLDDLIEEYIYLLCFNIRYEAIGVFEISHGGMDFAHCDMKSVFVRALLCASSAFVMIHNHPTGNPAPSDEDKAIFERIKSCGKLVSIEVPDSIIIGKNMYYSFAENLA